MALKNNQRSILAYADWDGLNGPVLMGVLHHLMVKGKEVFSFEYDNLWLETHAHLVDPDLQLFQGLQYLNDDKKNFGIFLDSSPDRWGRVLMKRREAILARRDSRPVRTFHEIDFLLGVYDNHRMGAIRFKENVEGPFLNDNHQLAAPPWASIRELEHATLELEKDSDNDAENLRWLNVLIAPGSSLGGARPKASVVDPRGNLWIAKFPSTNDEWDIGGWEKVVHELAVKASLDVGEASTGLYYSNRHTFLSKRFDRTDHGQRIHFASAMTLLGYKDGANASEGASYLELAEFIMRSGANSGADLEELWRRIVFYICVSNTDDHLRNHGFLLGPKGWNLSPAYDINPVSTGTGLTLNITEDDNSLDLALAMEVARYFRLTNARATEITGHVKNAVKQWKNVAKRNGISRNEIESMTPAFRIS